MLPSPLVSISFFEALAHLFYSVSVADDILELDEKRAIHKEITNYWAYNLSGYSSSEIMFASMRQLIGDVMDNDEAFEQFKEFYNSHQKHFSIDVKKAIYDSASIIADSYANKNKAELTMLTQIKLLFT